MLLKLSCASADSEVMSAGGIDERLDRALHDRAAGTAPTTRRVADLRRRCVDLALAIGGDQRTWARISLAADLRALERYDEALDVLDATVANEVSPEAELAAYTCAIAIHCDRGHHGIAAKLERQAAREGLDLEFANACVRLYAELYAETEDAEHRARRDSYSAAIESFRGHSASAYA